MSHSKEASRVPKEGVSTFPVDSFCKNDLGKNVFF